MGKWRSTLESPRPGAWQNTEKASLHVREAVLSLPGFKRATMLVSREEGMARAIVYWDSRETLDSSFEPTKVLRAEYTEKFGAELVTVEGFEVAVQV